MRNVLFLVLITVILGFAGCTPAVDDSTPENITDENLDESQDNRTIINVEGFNFGYEPSLIRIQAGEEVRVVFESTEGFHDFVIEGTPDEIATAQISEGSTTTVDFSIDEPGEYTFYCSVGSHRERGMVGTLIVEG